MINLLNERVYECFSNVFTLVVDRVSSYKKFEDDRIQSDSTRYVDYHGNSALSEPKRNYSSNTLQSKTVCFCFLCLSNFKIFNFPFSFKVFRIRIIEWNLISIVTNRCCLLAPLTIFSLLGVTCGWRHKPFGNTILRPNYSDWPNVWLI